ncbi:MAG: tetracycline resistance MFS efflux pump [Prosthecochloris sp.]|uniref:Major facilitator superfamily MFS_1 n=1 Tax=Prosthecochloris aestuarii (strain DSM 271 / SK 413) TaxID=290512 RepID=B4S8E3_PROA2|nr:MULTISPECIES: tetracycline resistance MFS efflux pump [Prosthecochloris]ACF46330.1 major facilitator superfamily MFS_1 [Prosthecochloris aestuarii DSM 271]MCW8798302.1 tetracycline resistance MFS efflux pump [Prosthecochloris sp.]RDD30140.1 tetracycline resistance MFS efflux pump [Prosthecochloris sp. ZM]
MKKSPLVILFLTVLLDLIGFGIVLPLLPTYAKDLGASPLMIGFIAAVYSSMQFIFSPLWGKLSDVIGRRPVMLGSILLASISYVFFSQATTIPLLILARGMSGMGSANIAAAQAYITDVTDSQGRSKAMGMLGAAFGIGFIIGPLIGGFLKTNFGIEMVGLVAAALIGIDFILAIFFLPESNKEAIKISQLFTQKAISGPRQSVVALVSSKVSDYTQSVNDAFSSRPIAMLMTTNFIFTFGIVNMQIASILLWKEFYLTSDQQIGYLFAYVGFLSVIVQGGLIGKLNKILGEHKLFTWGHILSFIGVFFIPFVPQSNLFSIGLFILFFFAMGTSLVNPINISMTSLYSYNKKQGQIMGLAQSVNSFARILGPFSGSILYGINHKTPFIVAGILMIIGTVISLGLFKYDIEALEPAAESVNA